MELIHEILGAALFHSYGGGGILSGFLHPILGLDHLLAMVAVGFLSAQMGGRAIWTVPTAFVGVMAIGAIIGILGVPAPFVEYGITGSVLILGLGILAHRGNAAESEKAAKLKKEAEAQLNAKTGEGKATPASTVAKVEEASAGSQGLPEWLAITLVAVFAFFHGNAHGTELPELSETIGLIIAYIAGFLIATAGLHVIGALIGIMAGRSESGKMVMRITGGVIAAIGVFLIMGV